MNVHGLNLPTLVHLADIIGLTILMVWAIISDVRRYIIPNTLNLAIIVLFALSIFFLPIEPLSAAGAAAIVLLVGLGLFALGFMGGGDVKMIVALVLWTGWDIATANFLMLTAVTGGILVFIVLPLRWFLAPALFRMNPTRNLPRILTRGQPVPYGIAIAAAFLLLMYFNNIPVLR